MLVVVRIHGRVLLECGICGDLVLWRSEGVKVDGLLSEWGMGIHLDSDVALLHLPASCSPLLVIEEFIEASDEDEDQEHHEGA